MHTVNSIGGNHCGMGSGSGPTPISICQTSDRIVYVRPHILSGCVGKLSHAERQGRHTGSCIKGHALECASKGIDQLVRDSDIEELDYALAR
jgi:hypothetical protein